MGLARDLNGFFDNNQIKKNLNDLKDCFKGFILTDDNIDDNTDDSIDSIRYFINDIKTIDDFINNKEENEMRNEVLELWYEKKRNKVIDKYDKLEEEFNKTQYGVVESFNELVEKFNNDLEDLYKLDKVSEQFVLEENAPSNVYKYRIDYDKLRDEFVEKYITERNKELAKIEEKYREVKAQLSLSDNLDYQIDILNRYGILTKKDKKISE